MWETLSEDEDMPGKIAGYGTHLQPLDEDEEITFDEEKASSHLDLESDEDDEGGGDIHIVRECNIWRHFKYCTVSVYILLSVLLVSSIAALIVVVVLVVLPVRATSDFQETLCVALDVSRRGADTSCSCGRGCQSHFPCLLVTVRYSDSRHREHNASMHDNELVMGEPCTFYPRCKSSPSGNMAEVKEYYNTYGRVGQSFPCFYNPRDAAQVIRQHHFGVYDVVHGTVWTSLIVILSLAGLLLLLKRRRCPQCPPATSHSNTALVMS